MILEFCGLPGAGKTTLENVLMQILAERGHLVRRRDQAVPEYIRSRIWAAYRHKSKMRRVVTAIYKAQLFLAAFGPDIRQWNPASFTRIHLLRSSMRLAEDLLLDDWIDLTMEPGEIANLSEGTTQHLAGCVAWQEVLRHERHIGNAASYSMRYSPHNRAIFHIDVPTDVALERLVRRGTPSLWPPRARAEEVVDAFARGLRSALDAQAGCRITHVVHVDGTVPEADWPMVADSLVQLIEPLCVPTGQHARTTSDLE